MEIISPALRYHGAKFRLAPWVMMHFPAHTTYVEAFGGAAGVLLQKPRVYAEVYNDLDGDVANFFAVLRDPDLRTQLIESIVLTPYSRHEFEMAWRPCRGKVERARRLAVRAQMGFGSAGATKGSTGFRIDTKRQYSTAQQLWAEYPAALADAGQRFAGVLVENRPAIEVMEAHDGPETLHYVDPPYMHATRVMDKNRKYYRHEMSDEMHTDLLSVINKLSGYVVLSGYDHELYNSQLPGWTKRSIRSRISGGRGTKTRMEVIWINPRCAEALDNERVQKRMFA
ncbi:DNA adenine methylase [Pseudomethylobacillus aquaticus]|uniref:DNA adenine methylase n=1 Tax=Pseudomethylobacillus aquaticus TaxID=2676064 RepID=A0A3N0V748_9PROT|nr:DNA adenine methylase [Pseudomethylobacillus aquaticus]